MAVWITLEQAEDMVWGTYGKGGMAEHVVYGTDLPALVEKRLGDLDTDHLEAILHTQKQLTKQYKVAIRVILKARTEVVEDRIRIRRRDAIEHSRTQVSEPSGDKKEEGD